MFGSAQARQTAESTGIEAATGDRKRRGPGWFGWFLGALGLGAAVVAYRRQVAAAPDPWAAADFGNIPVVAPIEAAPADAAPTDAEPELAAAPEPSPAESAPTPAPAKRARAPRKTAAAAPAEATHPETPAAPAPAKRTRAPRKASS